MKRFRLQSDLSEKQIEADVATYFGWISPDDYLPFRLLDIDERITGADKQFDYIIPIYMQFKVAEGLSSISRFDLGLSPYRRIQKYRQQNSLYHNPTLYFKVRDLAKNAQEYQHNILYKLANNYNTHAFYVAPLTLSRDEYNKMFFDNSNRYLLHPFYYLREQKIRNNDSVTFLKGIPFLRAHISIHPHQVVRSANHYYSFSPNGTEIAWHSPQYLPDRISRLSDTLSNIIRLTNRNQWFSLEAYIGITKELEREFNLERDESNDENLIVQLLQFGRKLYSKYGIRQVLVATTEEGLSKI